MAEKTETFDVCVIGSGPAGGVLAKELAEKGAKVVLVEAGRTMTHEDFLHHEWPFELPYRGTRVGGQPAAAYPRELTEAIRYETSDRVHLDRMRAVGGRSIHWNANCLRFAPRDFRQRSLTGVEEDWPLSYDELASCYAHVERMIGVTGSSEKLEVLPDGEFLPPLKLRCSDEIVKRACAKMGIAVIPARKAVLTKAYDNRPACHYCGHCMRGCDVDAIFTVPNSMLPKARATGNFTLLSNRLAREILSDDEGKALAVSVTNTVTRGDEEIRAHIFAVCCGACESARLLLNSRSSRYPNGLANSNDMVGRYLAGSVASGAWGYAEELAGTPLVNNDGATDHAYIPRFNHLDGRKRDYIGGYGYHLNFATYMFPHHAKYLKGFGQSFKREVRRLQPGFIQMSAWGNVLGRPESRITVDRNRLDAYGIPIPVVQFRFSDNERALIKEAVEKAKEILHAVRCELILTPHGLEPGGFGSHETGTVRMGKHPRTSVLNSFCQAHEVKNLFVVGGSSFTTYPEKNPTHTIMALAVRTASYIAEEVRKRNL